MDRVIAHIDMDCFFVSCEEKRNPSLKGKPVLVGATGNRGVVCASNYEARKFGVYSATPILTARKLCPDGIFLPVDHNYYSEQSNRIMDILSEVSDDMQQVSVDEAYVDLTSFSQDYPDLKQMAEALRQFVLDKTQLSCSIGVAQCKTVAKIASDFNKPAGVTIVKDPTEFLRPLPIHKFPGIGKVSKRYYHKQGVDIIGDLMNMDRFKVLDKFGLYGVKFQDIALGNDFTGIVHREGRKSISNERTFLTDVKDVTVLENMVERLAEKVHSRLGDHYYKTVTLKVRYADFKTITRDVTLQTATSSLETVKNATLALFRKYCTTGRNIRLIGVRVSHLAEGCGKQTTLAAFAQSPTSAPLMP